MTGAVPDHFVGRVERALGVGFRDPALCLEALTHRSAAVPHNERLEFLGDGVLNCAVADLLYRTQPQCDEGRLSRMRSSLVNGETLAQVAAELELGTVIRLGPGETISGGQRRTSILANVLEALIGAVFLDRDFETAASVVERLLTPRMAALPDAEELKDAKSLLQERLQARGLAPPAYRTTAVGGSAHAQEFSVACEISSLNLKTFGQGTSRRRAEQDAAARMLDVLAEPARSSA